MSGFSFLHTLELLLPPPPNPYVFCSMNKYYVVWCSLLFDMKKGNSLGWRRRGRETPFFTWCIKHSYTDLNSQKSNKTVKIMIKQLLGWQLCGTGERRGRAAGQYCGAYGALAGQLLNPVAGFCLRGSASFGSVAALQKLPVPLAGGPLARCQACGPRAEAGHVEKLLIGEHSRLLTLVTNQIICLVTVNGDPFPSQLSGSIPEGKCSAGMLVSDETPISPASPLLLFR